MINLELPQSGNQLKVLCLGAHCDDIEIGCGGTILKLVEKYDKANFFWAVLSSDKIRKKEAEDSAHAFLAGSGNRSVIIKEYKDGFFPYIGGEIKEYFELLKQQVDPDLIFTHLRSDLHQDHRLVSDLTWNTFRNHLILEYEIPKYDGDLGAPNIFVPLEEEICRTKIKNILTYFTSQAGNQWFTEETFKAILRLRGIESNAPTQFAEAFQGRKLIVD